ncbi:SMC-Scp complex subunit ScpB [Agrobacterium rubi]|nr:SMC-Scp complex subunit ScpB [Agrobacterium rubi]NTF24155.1 SMC-Scp complex subunit ScpB [Agrobacterium rubi]
MSVTTSEIELQIEALLVASPSLQPIERIRSVFGADATDLAITNLTAWWRKRGMTVYIKDGFISMIPSKDAVIALNSADKKNRRRLTDAAVETLAYIAFHQPVTVPDIEKARGVSLSKGLVDSLLDAGYVKASLRKTNSGRAVMYMTTDLFLDHYGLTALSDLPTPEEMEDFSPPPRDGHIENDVPQPHEEDALGLEMTNFSSASVDFQST